MLPHRGTCQQQHDRMALLVPVARDVAMGMPAGALALEAVRRHGIYARVHAPVRCAGAGRCQGRLAMSLQGFPSSGAFLAAQLTASCSPALPSSDKVVTAVVHWR